MACVGIRWHGPVYDRLDEISDDMDEFTDTLGLPRLQTSLRQLGCYKRLSTRLNQHR